jgi:hypothetical protein
VEARTLLGRDRDGVDVLLIARLATRSFFCKALSVLQATLIYRRDSQTNPDNLLVGTDAKQLGFSAAKADKVDDSLPGQAPLRSRDNTVVGVIHIRRSHVLG